MSEAEEWKPGQDTQAVATARLQGQDPDKIHCPVWGVIGNLGDSICYAGVPAKVEAIQAELRRRVTDKDLPVRVIAPNYASGISDGQRNGTPEMRYSLIGRETTNDGVCLHLEGSDIRGVIAVVACDKPPVGTLAAILEHNVPAVVMSDGSIRPGIDSLTGEPIDIISCFQAAAESPAERRRLALEGSPGHGSCGGMFTYNTMQSFIATCGMEPLHMVSPASEDLRRIEEFPGQLLDTLEVLSGRNLRPRDIVTPAALRNATLVAIAMGGSTNVVLHAPELARAAGIDYWREVISQEEFNRMSRSLPVLVNARERRDPEGKHLFTRLTIFNATDRRRYERDLVEARAAADTANQKLKALNTSVSASLASERETGRFREQFVAVLGHVNGVSETP